MAETAVVIKSALFPQKAVSEGRECQIFVLHGKNMMYSCQNKNVYMDIRLSPLFGQRCVYVCL